MKKLLKMLLTLSTTAVVPLTVVACGQESLDSNLSAVYKGTNDHAITLISGKTISTEKVKNFVLTETEMTTLAKSIVHEILAAAGLADVTWYQNDLAVNQKCYNFSITNGTVQADTTSKQWDVDQKTQRFNINISYFVGSVTGDHKFNASQKIDKSFNIKVGTSDSDVKLKNWIIEFNKQPWNEIAKAIEVDITSLKLDLPSGVSWNDLDKKITAATNDAIVNAISKVDDPQWTGRTDIALAVKSSKDKVDPTNHTLELILTANFHSSYTGDGLAPTINNTFIKFVKK